MGHPGQVEFQKMPQDHRNHAARGDAQDLSPGLGGLLKNATDPGFKALECFVAADFSPLPSMKNLDEMIDEILRGCRGDAMRVLKRLTEVEVIQFVQPGIDLGLGPSHAGGGFLVPPKTSRKDKVEFL